MSLPEEGRTVSGPSERHLSTPASSLRAPFQQSLQTCLLGVCTGVFLRVYMRVHACDSPGISPGCLCSGREQRLPPHSWRSPTRSSFPSLRSADGTKLAVEVAFLERSFTERSRSGGNESEQKTAPGGKTLWEFVPVLLCFLTEEGEGSRSQCAADWGRFQG